MQLPVLFPKFQEESEKLTGCFMSEVTLIVLVPLVPEPPWLYM